MPTNISYLLITGSLKINFKLGGRNHDIKGGLGLKQNTMVVGADVTHYTSPDAGCPSLAGIVACAAECWKKEKNGSETFKDRMIISLLRGCNQTRPRYVLFRFLEIL